MDSDLPDLHLEAILEEELYTNPPLRPVVVAKLVGTKQDITRVFRLTREIASVADLKHLRRIRDVAEGQMECIICSLDVDSKTDRLAHDADTLTEAHEALLGQLEARFANDNILKDFRVALVPSEAPRTDHQLRACQKLWPCKYAKSNYLIRCIEGSALEQAERLVVKIIANSLLRHINAEGCSSTSGAVIFRYARVYGVGLSCLAVTQANPTKHSAMLAIDSVARNAGSGCWLCHGEEEDTLGDSIQQQLGPRPELAGHKMEADFLPYLCTNYDVLLTEEPCMMCAMGLVQSRIRRLFYLDLKSEGASSRCRPVCYPDGAIERFLVHRDKSLNHRFEAWRIKLTN